MAVGGPGVRSDVPAHCPYGELVTFLRVDAHLMLHNRLLLMIRILLQRFLGFVVLERGVCMVFGIRPLLDVAKASEMAWYDS